MLIMNVSIIETKSTSNSNHLEENDEINQVQTCLMSSVNCCIYTSAFVTSCLLDVANILCVVYCYEHSSS